MATTKAQSKVIKTLPKGQITLPAEYRAALGIEADTLLTVSLVGDHLEVSPLRNMENDLRRYTDEEVAAFLEEDKLDEATAAKVRQLLREGKL